MGLLSFRDFCATALLALLIAGPAGANGYPETAEHVATVVSLEPVADVDAWVAGMAPVAGDWTGENGVEACGVIAQSPDGRLGIVLGSTRSPYNCGFSHANVPAGFTSTGETFHTHPPAVDGKAKLTMAQRREFGDHRVSEKDFSPQDYRDGPGYVWTSGMLLHQSGPGTRRVVSTP